MTSQTLLDKLGSWYDSLHFSLVLSDYIRKRLYRHVGMRMEKSNSEPYINDKSLNEASTESLLEIFFEEFQPLKFIKCIASENILQVPFVKDSIFDLVPQCDEFYARDPLDNSLKLNIQGIRQLLIKTEFLHSISS